jgi:NTP pyrophosphatase (non-canonical NTP hydrolase)
MSNYRTEEEEAALHGGRQRLSETEAMLASIATPRATRNALQQQIGAWIVRTFGEHTMALHERRARFLEEALELVQACEMPKDDVLRLVEYVYGRKAGDVRQEIGGVGVTLLGLAQSFGISADQAEREEVARVLAIPAEHFRKRHDAKADEGVAVYSMP